MSRNPKPFLLDDTHNKHCNVIEVWRSEAHCDDLDEEFGLHGVIIKTIIDGNQIYYSSTAKLPLSLLMSYMRGIKYSVVIQDFFLDSYVTPSGVLIPGHEPVFVPMVSEEDLEEFAARCVEHGMFE